MHQLNLLKNNNSLDPAQIENWVHQWGSAATEMLLDSSFQFFCDPEIEGFIGYRVESHCAITFGDPVCSVKNRPHLALSFQHFCKTQGFHVIYLVVSKQFSDWALGHNCHISIEVGEELILDRTHDPREGPKASKLRNMTAHARSLGLTVREYLTEDPRLEKEMLEVGMNWLYARKGPQIHLSNLSFFERRVGRRWFYVTNAEGTILGVAVLSWREVEQRWMLKFLTTVPEIPRGTSELLLVSIIDALKENFSYGLTPAMKLGEIRGLSQFSAVMSRIAYKFINWLFLFDNRRTYWQKFHPKREPFYIVFTHPTIRLNEIRALIKSLQIHL